MDRATAWLFAGLANAVGADVARVGAVLTIGGLNRQVVIGYGCDGVLANLLLCSVIIPIPVTIRLRPAGLAAGLVFVLVMNQLRVAGLVLSLTTGPNDELFEFYHIYVGQMFAVAIVFVFWSHWLKLALNKAKS